MLDHKSTRGRMRNAELKRDPFFPRAKRGGARRFGFDLDGYRPTRSSFVSCPCLQTSLTFSKPRGRLVSGPARKHDGGISDEPKAPRR